MQNAIRAGVIENRQVNAAIISPPPRSEYTAVEGNFTFTYAIDANAQAHIVRCKGAGSTLRIPIKLGGCTVVALDRGACAHLMHAERIVLPETLVSIGAHAFEGCLSLREIALPNQLEELGSEAFLLCSSLERVRIPKSVRHLGAHIAGASSTSRLARRTLVEIDEENPHIFTDENGILYEHGEHGLIAIDASSYEKSTLELDSATTAIGSSAFAQNCAITHAPLPEGLLEIGESAFRGCNQLASVDFPSTLQTIRNGAFACTKLASARIPARCVNIDPAALNTGSANYETLEHPYASTLVSINVSPDNPAYCMHGGMLCRRIEGGDRLEAVLCTREAESVELDRHVARIARGAFSGTVHVETLRVHEHLSCARSCRALAHVKCSTLILDCENTAPYGSQLRLEMPQDGLRERILEAGLAAGSIDIEKILTAYDEALLHVDDAALRARLMLARLAMPKPPDGAMRKLFEQEVLATLESLIVYFGARQYWSGYHQLFKANMLTQTNIEAMVALLSERGDTSANAYLLELKREYLGCASWDYEL